MVTCNNFLTEEPQLFSVLRISLLSGAVCLVRVSRYTLLHVRVRNCNSNAEVLTGNPPPPPKKNSGPGERRVELSKFQLKVSVFLFRHQILSSKNKTGKIPSLYIDQATDWTTEK